MTHRHLILRLEAPLMAFGGTMIDAIGPTLEMPIKSMITGLLANALGWQRGDRAKHRDLQDRIVMGVRLDRVGTELYDFQTALLFEDENNWTTRGKPEGRKKSPSYSWGKSGRKELNHIRNRFYRADAFVTVAVRLARPSGTPTLDEIASALRTPARPLFIGRKPCLPARPVFANEIIDAANVYGALKAVGIIEGPPQPKWRKNDEDRVRLAIPPGEGRPAVVSHQTATIADVRDWMAGVHAGENRLDIFSQPRADFPSLPPGALP